MPIITALVDTVLKKRNEQLTELSKGEYINVGKGAKFAVTLTVDIGQSYLITFQGDFSALNIKAGQRFYIYAPHFQITDKSGIKSIQMENVLIKNVPFYSQDVSTADPDGFRECNGHANAMLCEYLLDGQYDDKVISNRDQPELLYIDRVRRFGDTTDHNAQTQALQSFGVESYWSDRISAEILMKSLHQSFNMGDRLVQGVPVVCGINYKQSGHILIIKGYKDHSFICNDSNGIRNGLADNYWQYSTHKNKIGESDVLSSEFMRQKFWDLGINSGYGRIVTKVLGYATGL